MQENKFDSVIKFGILNNKQNLLTSFRGEKKFGASNIILEIRAYIRVDVHTTHPEQKATVVIM
jgi:hypothetical protein